VSLGDDRRFGVAGEHDDGGMVAVNAERPDELDAVHVRHVAVGEDHVGPDARVGKEVKGGGAVAVLDDLKPFATQKLAEDPAVMDVVLNEQKAHNVWVIGICEGEL
jgi:hypothetical protein